MSAEVGRRVDVHGEGLRYATVFHRLETDILTGRLAPGERLAPERELGPRLGLGEVDFSTASLYATLRDRAGVVPSRVDVVLRAVRADHPAAELLEMEEGGALLELSETVFDQYGEPFETATLFNRGDRYAFGTTLTADTGLPRVELRRD